MKKYIIGIMSAAALSCIVLSCAMPAEPQDEAQTPAQAEPGFGKVSISFSTGPARTVFPVMAFQKYTYVFTTVPSTGQNATTVQGDDAKPEMLGGPITLKTGNWTVTVKAYVSEDDSVTDFAASSTAIPFTVRTGAVTQVSVPLTGTASGAGTFKWNIQQPAGATLTFTMTPLTPPGGSATPLSGWVNTTGQSFSAGYYLASVQLTRNGSSAGKSEVVHIYKNMTTEFGTAAAPIAFTDADFERPEINATVSIKNADGSDLASPPQSGQVIKAVITPADPADPADPPFGTKSYQWYRRATADGTVENIGTDSVYTITDADGGKYISVTVTCANYRNTLSADAVGPVKKNVADVAALRAFLAGLPANPGTTPPPVYEVAFTGTTSLASLIVTDADRAVLNEKSIAIDLSALTGDSIASSAFQNCTTLTKITLPASLTMIWANAFNGCSALTEVICRAATPPDLSGSAFLGCNSLTSIKVPSSSLTAYQEDTNWSSLLTTPNEITALP